MAAKNSF